MPTTTVMDGEEDDVAIGADVETGGRASPVRQEPAPAPRNFGPMEPPMAPPAAASRRCSGKQLTQQPYPAGAERRAECQFPAALVDDAGEQRRDIQARPIARINATSRHEHPQPHDGVAAEKPTARAESA